MQARQYGYFSSVFWVFRDEASDAERIKRLTFHVEQEDYFPFLATILGFLKESLMLKGGIITNEDDMHQREFIEDTQKDLLYLQRHYSITPKETPTSYTSEKVIRFKP